MREAIRKLLGTLRGPSAKTSRALREGLLGGSAPGGDLDGYVEKVRRHAYQITDDDVAALRAAGHSEDELFEVTVCAAVEASLARLDAGLAPIGRSR